MVVLDVEAAYTGDPVPVPEILAGLNKEGKECARRALGQQRPPMGDQY